MAVVAIAIAMRVAAFLYFGPVYQPDSSDFTRLATAMLKSSEWLSFADIEHLAGYNKTLRMLGYPWLIAGLQFLFGGAADHVAVLLQALCSIVATGLVFRVGRAIGLGVAASCFVALAHTSSIAFLFDFNILVDSFYANGLLIAACLLTLGIYGGSAPKAARILAISLLLVGSFLVRETTMFFVPIWAIGVVIWARRTSASWMRSLLYAVLFVLPVLLAGTAYREWNRYRTGVPFLTTGAQLSMWFGPVEVARKQGVALYADDPRIVEAMNLALQADPDFPMTGASAINEYLFAQGFKATDVAALGFKAFGMALKGAPMTLITDRLTRYRPRAVLLLVNASMPLESLNDFSQRRDNTAFFARGRAAMAAGGIAGAITLTSMALEVAQIAVSAVLLLAFVAGIPLLVIYALLHARRLDVTLLVLGWFWCMYWGVNGAYILASFEARYALPTLPLACLGGVWVCLKGVQALRSVRNASYSRI
jgi:hypothetical protein